MFDGNTPMLFDVERDPGERDDLYYRNPSVAANLARALADWEKRMPGAPRP